MLVADDSRFMRMVISRMLASDPGIDVVGMAADGLEVIEAVTRLAPQVVTMDVCMPHADGLAAVEQLMVQHPIPILMISSQTQKDSVATLKALELGAVDFVAKPSGSIDLTLDELREEIIAKVKVAARVRPVRNVGIRTDRQVLARPGNGEGWAVVAPTPGTERGPWETPCVVIAASTGGPAALLKTIPKLPRLSASVLIVQHIPAYHTTHLARELAARSAIPVKEAGEGERLMGGVAYIAPGSMNLTVSARGSVTLAPAAKKLAGCPSADIAMASVARYWGSRCLGVVLTGMGRDGAEGVRAIRESGGVVIAQDEASSLIYGMPKAAVETGCVDVVVPVGRLPEAIEAGLRQIGDHGRSATHAS